LEDIRFDQFISGVEIYSVTQCKSTQTLCVSLLENKLKSFNYPSIVSNSVAVFTYNQTNGVGQASNIWESQPGKNLAYTLGFVPDDSINLIHLNKALSLAVCKTIQSFVGHNAKIKWPNDIYVNAKKVAGLLFQVQSVANQRIVVLGVGVNVNQIDWPIHLPNAASLCDFANQEIFIPQLINELTNQLTVFLNLLKDKNRNISEMFRHELWGLQEKRNLYIADSQNTVQVEIIDVDEFGRIVVAFENGEIHRFHHGQAFIRV
jgi:BirA family biotin operon repressor/biotin-[acetyl-CoA-carboxylase] ligase